ncbi:uncharacterized protein EI90DRAFT_3289365 [Cantharellus anzutake]|uniref:uncharacterized protein n=1 Tax=Cantharellus anzutake TaxID=1750568 RepID=UPI001908002A|nr:uncharacterized protein EI90DRAFT_3289365 [Cantharellus anzutake]KAF8331707.1 hypothetical protein EI90DRAFT_3289365 [Cantharellus anzutake]
MATALINVLLAHNVYSAPIPPHNTTCFLQNVSDGCNDLRNCRTMWGIVYSCLLTVSACIWTAVHPDLPEPDVGIWSITSRVGLMMVSLVSPEAILAFAWHQSLLSWRISKKCKMVKGWTSTHSYFVVMDGFFDPSEGRAVRLDDLQRYPGIIKKTGNTRRAAITKKEILDRSKGDPFSLSQLETMTLAYAALSVFVIVLWWHKPVNIRLPIHVTEQSPPISETNANQPTPKMETDANPMSLVQVSEPETMEVISIFIATGIIFGGIHCLAWSFPFPTLTEMILWRVSAIYITVAPAFVMLAGWVTKRVKGDLGFNTGLLISVVYSVARVILLALTFSSLRSPPPDLYQTPSWSSFLPHFGLLRWNYLHIIVPGRLETERGQEAEENHSMAIGSRTKYIRDRALPILGIANNGQNNSNDSQFFITLDRADEFQRKHTLFGTIVGNTVFNVLKIGECDTDLMTLYPAQRQRRIERTSWPERRRESAGGGCEAKERNKASCYTPNELI